jgi:hypothetical protein
MNRTAEVIVTTQRETHVDMIEFRSLQTTAQGRCAVFDWRSIPFAQADHNTLLNAFRRRQFNCYLWRKMIDRSIYERALLISGTCTIEAFITLPVAERRIGVFFEES